MSPLKKKDLYDITGWFSKDCNEIIEKLKKYNLSIVKTKDIDDVNWMISLLEDDLK